MKHALQFLSRIGTTSTFFDPLNIDNKLTHRVSLTRRNVGSSRLRQVRNDFTQIRNYKYKSCTTDKCGTNDFVGANVSLFGITADEVVRNWNDLKLNVDAAIAAGVLGGVPLSMAIQSLQIEEPVLIDGSSPENTV